MKSNRFKWMYFGCAAGLAVPILHAFFFLERNVLLLLVCVAVGWFVIPMVLLYRPPGVPKVDFKNDFENPIDVSRTDAFKAPERKYVLPAASAISTLITIGAWLWLVFNRNS